MLKIWPAVLSVGLSLDQHATCSVPNQPYVLYMANGTGLIHAECGAKTGTHCMWCIELVQGAYYMQCHARPAPCVGCSVQNWSADLIWPTASCQHPAHEFATPGLGQRVFEVLFFLHTSKIFVTLKVFIKTG